MEKIIFNKSVIFFDRIIQRYTPEPFVLALFLTCILFILAITLTETTPFQMIIYWGDGFWKLTTFTLQMVMILMGGSVVASSPFVNRLLSKIVVQLKSTGQAVIVITMIALIASWINWGFGLVIGALFCRKIASTMPSINFKLLVASSYSGFLIWHAGLSGSIPLLLATPDNFSEKLMGKIIPVNQTIFSIFNLTATFTVSIAVIILNYFINKRTTEKKIKTNIDKGINHCISKTVKLPIEHIENSRILSLFAFLLGASYVGYKIIQKSFILDLNSINMILIFLGIILHKNINNFIQSIIKASKRVGPILLQFPFYAAIMNMMTSSGLSDLVSQFFINISSPKTFQLLVFYSAGLVNIFVPSGGGQWAIQAPIMIPVAQKLGLDTVKTAMAIAWGDAWTNMLQPFWALSILAIAGLHLRDIMGHCISIFIVSGTVLSIFFLFF